MRPHHLLITTLAVLTLAVGSAQAAVIADFDFEGDSDADTANVANVTVTDIVLDKNTGSIAGGDKGFTNRGSRARFLRYNATTTTTTTTNAGDAYFGFTVEADAGYTLDLDSFQFDVSASSGGNSASFQVYGKIGAGSFAAITSNTAITTINTSSTATVGPFALGSAYDDVPAGTNVEFRVYLADDVDTSSAHSFDDVIVNGSVALIPEPATLALLGLGGAVMLAGRRRS